ncbi:MAG: hypothetical protein H0V66_09460 [Bdellovibrionales bacterium]|nr:hypothetical protein [Bdellovibrionales bacterium]
MKNIFLTALPFLFSFSALAQVVTAREIMIDGKRHIEETTKGSDGTISKQTYLKPGQDKLKVHAKKEGPVEVGDAFGNALINCVAYQSTINHPLLQGHSIQMQVHGKVDGKCKFTQTMPVSGVQTCLFSDEERAQIKSSPKALEGIMQKPGVCQISGGK